MVNTWAEARGSWSRWATSWRPWRTLSRAPGATLSSTSPLRPDLNFLYVRMGRVLPKMPCGHFQRPLWRLPLQLLPDLHLWQLP